MKSSASKPLQLLPFPYLDRNAQMSSTELNDRSEIEFSLSPTEPQNQNQTASNNNSEIMEVDFMPQVQEIGKVNKRKSNGINMFAQKMKKLQSKDNPNGVLNMPAVRQAWNTLAADEKKKFKEVGQDQQSSTDSISSKERRRARDKKYSEKKALLKKQEKEDKANFIKQFENLMEEKRQNLKQMEDKKADLEKEVSAAVTENEVFANMIKNLSEEERHLKLKLKEALCHHKQCKK